MRMSSSGSVSVPLPVRPYIPFKVVLEPLSPAAIPVKLVELPELDRRSRSRPPTDRWILCIFLSFLCSIPFEEIDVTAHSL